jgi:putative NADH-flavin reductase
MRVLILGATGRLGSRAVDRALAAGHEVTAIVRDPGRIAPRPGLIVRAGDVTTADTFGEPLDVDAVIAAVGPRSNTPDDERALEDGMRNLVQAMDDSGVRRLVALSGAGIDVPGDSKPLVDRLASRFVRRMARHVVGAKQREFEVFAASDLDWTALRPPLVTDGPAQGYRLDLTLKPAVRVRRDDIAAALVDQLTDDTFVRAAPFVLPLPRGTGQSAA